MRGDRYRPPQYCNNARGPGGAASVMKNFFKPQKFTRRRASCYEDGYALMMVVFFTALMLIGAMVVAPRILQEGKREKEKEMIWRGKQYVRGVKLYYRKMGRFPTSIDDLTKPKTGSLRFMRQAYKDPMNNADGSWRFIYVGPAGQLIGSLKPPQTLHLPGAGGGLGTPASTLATNSAQKTGEQAKPLTGTQNGAPTGTQTEAQPDGTTPAGTDATASPADAMS